MRPEPIDLVFWAVALFWLVYSLRGLLAFHHVHRLPALDDLPLPVEQARVSILVAACNEQERIANTVSRLLEQTGVEIELFVSEDRSTDRTREILRGLARTHPRLGVVEIDRLPPGWLGKPHALHVAAQRATGDWLLFTDADAWMTPQVIARAVAVAEQEGVDHLCLFPGEASSTLLCTSTLLFASVGGGAIAASVNRDSKWFGIGVGAFNLVRAEAYRAVGGHVPLRFEVIDDVKLGLLLNRAGHATRIFDANRDVEVHWAPSVPSLLRAVEKNLFALLEFSPLHVGLAALAASVAWGGALLGPASGTWAGFAAGLALASTIVPAWMAARRTGDRPLAALLAPLTMPILVAALVRSAFKTLRQGGIVWRGTFYALADLRRRPRL